MGRPAGFPKKGQRGERGEQAAQTPDWLWSALEDVYGKFDFDPCPHAPTFNGLSVPWKRLNYCNPPYNNVRAWIEKALQELKHGRATVFLIPFRPTSKYFQELVFPNASELRILGQRIAFKGFEKTLPLRLVAVLFGKAKKGVGAKRSDTRTSAPLYIIPMPADPKKRTVESLQSAGKYDHILTKPKAVQGRVFAFTKDLQPWLEFALGRKESTDILVRPTMESNLIANVLSNPRFSVAFPAPYLVRWAKDKDSTFRTMLITTAPAQQSWKRLPKAVVWTPNRAQFDLHPKAQLLNG
jgi:hypothetical protein